MHCAPHVDFKNLAIGICVIFIYGICFGSTSVLMLTCLLQVFSIAKRGVGWSSGRLA